MLGLTRLSLTGTPGRPLDLADPGDAPVALDATDITLTSLVAQWENVTGSLSYIIDVASDPDFNNFIFENLDVGDVTNFFVDKLTPGLTLYYRVRAVTGLGTSVNSNVITATTDFISFTVRDPGEVTIESLGNNFLSVATIDGGLNFTRSGVDIRAMTYDNGGDTEEMLFVFFPYDGTLGNRILASFSLLYGTEATFDDPQASHHIGADILVLDTNVVSPLSSDADLFAHLLALSLEAGLPAELETADLEPNLNDELVNDSADPGPDGLVHKLQYVIDRGVKYFGLGLRLQHTGGPGLYLVTFSENAIKRFRLTFTFDPGPDPEPGFLLAPMARPGARSKRPGPLRPGPLRPLSILGAIAVVISTLAPMMC